MSIEAVLFDFGGVLTESLDRLVLRIAQSCGADVGELVDLLVGGYGDDGDHPWHRLERGEIPFTELCAWARAEGERRGWDLNLADMPELVGSLAPRPDVVDRARDLRGRGYRTALVTNNAREFGTAWQNRLPFEDLFDVVVDSSKVGVRKPDPRIYRLTLDRLGGLRPEHAVLLDDFEVNLAGARAIGMHAILVGRDSGAALDELEELLAGVSPGVS